MISNNITLIKSVSNMGDAIYKLCYIFHAFIKISMMGKAITI